MVTLISPFIDNNRRRSAKTKEIKMSFKDFKGRKREKERIIQVLNNLNFWKNKPDNFKQFFLEQYSDAVPFHNHVHIGFGLMYLFGHSSSTHVDCLWLGHDAGHNGNAAESPEEKSAVIYNQNFPNQISDDDLYETILFTKFPYTKMSILGQEYLYDIGNFLRMIDTLRCVAGDLAYAEKNGKWCATGNWKQTDFEISPFIFYFFESGLLWLELKKSPLDWMEKGQLGFFFPQIRLALMNEMYTFQIDDDIYFIEYEFPIQQIVAQAWENEAILRRLLSTIDGRNKLEQAVHFLLDDVTLPEFAKFANEIGLV